LQAAVPQRTWVREFDNPTGMISYSCLGARRIIPYSSSALAYFLNSPNYIKSARTNYLVKAMIGDGILTAEHEAHRRQRRILTPAFGVPHIREITPHFWTKGHQLVEAWKPIVESQPSEGIDVTKWLNRVALDIIGLAGLCPLLLGN
jgi:cytochrome P450